MRLTPSEVIFRDKVRSLLDAGIKPTPKELQKYGYGNGRTLGGRRSTIRIEEFERAGWAIGPNGRWTPPALLGKSAPSKQLSPIEK